MISIFDKSIKHFPKTRKCWLPEFSPFPTMFSKAFFLGVSGLCSKKLTLHSTMETFNKLGEKTKAFENHFSNWFKLKAFANNKINGTEK